jgi:hypothetical protein
VVQIRPSGSARNVQQLANLRVREALHIMQHYYRPRTRRKLRQRGIEPFLQLAVLRWIAKGRGHRFRELLGVPHLFSASQIERRICDNSIEPGAESLRGVKPVEGLVRAEESLLNRVLSILVGHDDRSRHYIRPALVQPNKPGETTLVALAGQTYEVSLLIRNT